MDLTCKTDGCDEEASCVICMRCNTHHTKDDREAKVAAVAVTLMPLLMAIGAVVKLAAFTDDEIGLFTSSLTNVIKLNNRKDVAERFVAKMDEQLLDSASANIPTAFRDFFDC